MQDLGLNIQFWMTNTPSSFWIGHSILSSTIHDRVGWGKTLPSMKYIPLHIKSINYIIITLVAYPGR